jgi:hypothetical protein
MSEYTSGEAMFNVFSLSSSLFTLAYRSFLDLHGEMVFYCVLQDM